MSRIAIGAFSPERDPYKGRPLGRVLIKLGKITREQAHQGLALQAQQKKQGEPMLLGQVLIQLGVCTPQDVALALKLQAGLSPDDPHPNN